LKDQRESTIYFPSELATNFQQNQHKNHLFV
jgi:hypothetical protein